MSGERHWNEKLLSSRRREKEVYANIYLFSMFLSSTSNCLNDEGVLPPRK
jgi:hypothetical protein